MLTWQFFLGYWATWTPEKKITLKKRSINGREEMASHNSCNYCLSECCTAQIAGYRVYLLYFFIKRGHGHRTEWIPWLCCVTGHTTQSQNLLCGTSDLERCCIHFSSCIFLWWIYCSINPKEQVSIWCWSSLCQCQELQEELGLVLHLLLRLFMAELMLWLHSPLQAKEGMNLPWGFLFL